MTATPGSTPAPEPALILACTSCRLTYTPDPGAFAAGNTGCPRCGGWTWIAALPDLVARAT